MSKNYKGIKNISWKFTDSASAYPELRNRDFKIKSPSDFFNNFRFLFDLETQEVFYVFWLSSANKVIGFEMVTKGTLNASIVHAREIFRSAIVSSCNSIIAAHNHPSGNPEPSDEDIVITRRLIEAGKIIDIKVLDHVIFAGSSYTSLVERNII